MRVRLWLILSGLMVISVNALCGDLQAEDGAHERPGRSNQDVYFIDHVSDQEKLYGILDGHGGKSGQPTQAGIIAKLSLVNNFKKLHAEGMSADEALTRAFVKTDLAIFSDAQSNDG